MLIDAHVAFGADSPLVDSAEYAVATGVPHVRDIEVPLLPGIGGSPPLVAARDRRAIATFSCDIARAVSRGGLPGCHGS
jgi:hypothetical protein